VIPLAASYLIYVVISIADNSALGKMGAYSLLVHIGILLTALIFSISVGFGVIALIGDNLPRLSVQESLSELSLDDNEDVLSVNYFVDLSRVVQKILGRAVLLILLLSVAFGFLVSRYYKEFKEKIPI